MKLKEKAYQIRWGLFAPCMAVGIVGTKIFLRSFVDSQLAAGLQYGLGALAGAIVYFVLCEIFPAGPKPENSENASVPNAGEQRPEAKPQNGPDREG
jgi:zinc transporter ZupT